jgi:hypothetical protein
VVGFSALPVETVDQPKHAPSTAPVVNVYTGSAKKTITFSDGETATVEEEPADETEMAGHKQPLGFAPPEEETP